jgi:hypothetical protein
MVFPRGYRIRNEENREYPARRTLFNNDLSWLIVRMVFQTNNKRINTTFYITIVPPPRFPGVEIELLSDIDKYLNYLINIIFLISVNVPASKR